MSNHALIVGATGIVGQNLSARLLAEGWVVHGLARRPPSAGSGIIPVAADLLDVDALRAALVGLRPTHVYFCSWMRMATEAENCRVNAAMVRNVFAALPAPRTIRHAALTTGLKHYLGPFEAYAQGGSVQTPFHEEMPRLPIANFYYDQEDALFEAAARHGFSWSVHRPSTIIGHAVGNAMNMGSTLAVYASLCRETRPSTSSMAMFSGGNGSGRSSRHGSESRRRPIRAPRCRWSPFSRRTRRSGHAWRNATA